MNVKVTGVPMRPRRMSTSVDPRAGQLVTRPCRRGCGNTHTNVRKLHVSTMTSQHATRDPTTQQQGWRFGLVSPWRLDHTRGSRQDNPQCTGAWFARNAVDGPIPPQRTRNALRTLKYKEKVDFVKYSYKLSYGVLNISSVICASVAVHFCVFTVLFLLWVVLLLSLSSWVVLSSFPILWVWLLFPSPFG